ncbi:hypothetical protein ACLMJK_002504 [Lecanora helva]
MTDPNRQADALLTEHFQYTPLSLIDDIINAVNTIIFQAMEALENGMLQIPPRSLGFGRDHKSSASSKADNNGSANAEYPEATSEIENGVHQLETLLESTVDKAFDYFEIWSLRNVLTIPDQLAPWMRLSHYENLQLPMPSSAPTPESILTLRRKLQETKKLNQALRTTHARNSAILSQVKTILTSSDPADSSSLAFLTSPTNAATQNLNLSFTPSSTESRPLTTNAQSAASQLPALKELVAQLRPKVQDLREGAGQKIDLENKREERRAYIESNVRRVAGKAVSNGEEIRGEVRGREEVDGLEDAIKGMERG